MEAHLLNWEILGQYLTVYSSHVIVNLALPYFEFLLHCPTKSERQMEEKCKKNRVLLFQIYYFTMHIAKAPYVC